MAIVVPYSRQTQMESPSGYRRQSVANEQTFGAGVGQALSQAGDTAFQYAMQEREKNDAKIILDTVDAYKKDLINAYNGENGFFSLKGNNATNVVQQSSEFMLKQRAEYEKNLNPRQLDAFRKTIADTERTYYEGAETHQKREKDAAFVATINAGIATSSQAILANYQDNKLINSQLTDIDKQIAVYGVTNGWDQSQLKAKQLEAKTKAIRNAFDYAVNLNNLDRAQELLNDYGEGIDKTETGVMSNILRQKTETVKTVKIANDIVSQATSLDEALAIADRQITANTPRPVITWEQTKDLVAGNESSGNADPYTAVNSDSGAYGKYQFMPDTWRRLMGDAPKTPENQEIAIEKMHKKTYDLYGPSGVLVANYAGTQNAERYAKGLPLIGDNGNEYSADAPQYYNGRQYPSVNEYVQMALGSIAATPRPIAQEEERQRLREQVIQAWTTKEKLKNIQVSRAMDGFTQWVVNNKPSSVAEIEAAARSAGFTGSDLLNAIGVGKQMAGMMRVEQNQAEQDAYEGALRDIHDGNIASSSVLFAKYGNSIGIDKLITLENFINTTYRKDNKMPPEWQNSINIAAFNGVMREFKLQNTTGESRIMEKVVASIKDMKAKGQEVTRYDIERLAREQAQEIKINQGWLADTARLGDVPYGWSVDQNGTITAPDGTRPDKYKDGKFYIIRGGEEYEMRE